MKMSWQLHQINRDSNPLQNMLGVTFTKIEKDEANETLLFTASDCRRWLMGHGQDCCESVTIDDIVGDLEDLTNSPILVAEECSNEAPETAKGEYDNSFTWTFYRFRTNKGTVTIKWYGCSNGYYSEAVDIIELAKEIDYAEGEWEE